MLLAVRIADMFLPSLYLEAVTSAMTLEFSHRVPRQRGATKEQILPLSCYCSCCWRCWRLADGEYLLAGSTETGVTVIDCCRAHGETTKSMWKRQEGSRQ